MFLCWLYRSNANVQTSCSACFDTLGRAVDFVCVSLQGILLVYDITNRWSFDGIDRWIREIDEVSLGDGWIDEWMKHFAFHDSWVRDGRNYHAGFKTMLLTNREIICHTNSHNNGDINMQL